jgi:hypothetical protein
LRLTRPAAVTAVLIIVGPAPRTADVRPDFAGICLDNEKSLQYMK